MGLNNRDFSSEIIFKTSRSSGKGGQNVNKVESRVSLFFSISSSSLLSNSEKTRLINSSKISVNSNNEIQIDVEESRSQLKNKKIAIQRLHDLLTSALKKPKTRKATTPTKAAIRKRLRNKKAHSEKKKNRRKDF